MTKTVGFEPSTAAGRPRVVLSGRSWKQAVLNDLLLDVRTWS
jgi:hypothetical protein